MFTKLFALFFGKKKEPEPTATRTQRIEHQEAKREQRFVQPLRTGKARSSGSSTASARRDSDDIMSNSLHPLNPLNPLNPIGFNSAIYHDSTPSPVSHSSSYDCGSSSPSSYDSGSSSSSCDSGSSSSGGGD